MSHVRHSVTVGQPRQALYEFWRDFENLPRFMRHLERVKDLGRGRSRWVAKAPAGRRVEWDAEVIDDVPGERIAWRSLPGADVPNSGAVLFTDAPDDGGTEIIVDIRYDSPGGILGRALVRLVGGDPGPRLKEDLRRFKQIIEAADLSQPMQQA
jgi:uncharacterized membrane protein